MSSTNKTANYQLSQWLPTDKLCHEDVNADNLAVDTAIKALDTLVAGKASAAALQALESTVSGSGFLQVESGSYVGTGSYGASHKSSITFTKTPKLVYLFDPTKGVNAYSCFNVWWGSTVNATMFYSSTSNYTVPVTYSGNTMSWYGEITSDIQLNNTGVTYRYVALSW